MLINLSGKSGKWSWANWDEREMSGTIRLLLILLSLLMVFSCDKGPVVKKQNSFDALFGSEIATFDPARSNDTVSGTVIAQVYESLYEYNYLKRPYTLRPLLAESMPVIENGGTRYIINIKKNVRYHHDPAFGGKVRHVKAVDFVNQVKRLAYKKTKGMGFWIFDGKIKGINQFRAEATDLDGFFKTDILGVRASGDHTLIIELNKPFPQMLSALAMSYVVPIPEEVIRHYNNDLENVMVGTGPFKLKKWNRSSLLQLEKFENYREEFYPSQGDRWAKDNNCLDDAGKKIPFVDNINFHIISDAQTRWLNFFSKKVDFQVVSKDTYSNVIDINGKLSKELRAQGVKMQLAPKLTYWWLAFNMEDPILGKNRFVRMAIAHAINVDKYIDSLYIGQKANSIYPPGVPGYSASAQLPYKYNVELARKYLKRAGFPDGKGLPALDFDTRGNNASYLRSANFIKESLGKIGIKVNIQVNSFRDFLQKAEEGNISFWDAGWVMDYPDAENMLQLLISQNRPPGPNVSRYSNSSFDSLFNRLKVLANGPKKYAIMRKMEKLVHKDLPWIMLYYSKNYILYHGYLKNYRHSDVVINYMKYIRVNRP